MPELQASRYVGRFAPSPSGPLHDGSLVAAMASYLDARAHHGRWLVRIEDIDTPRVVAGADRVILQQLHALGMRADAPPIWQSARLDAYETAFSQLKTQGHVFGCCCTRQQVGRGPYPGTCRQGIAVGRRVRSWRFRVPEGVVRFTDRWQGTQIQDTAREVGDFIIRRADGLWAYQLVVVVDDAFQGITHIVRGADLLDSTARQMLLAQSLNLPSPRVMHVPLVLDDHGQKLSKQNHAQPFDTRHPVQTLNRAWSRLGFAPLAGVESAQTFWQQAVPQWAARFRQNI